MRFLHRVNDARIAAARRHCLRAVLALAAALLVGSRAAALEDGKKQPDRESSAFLRFVDEKDGGPTLETAVVSYSRGKGDDKVTVHLVGAVHIGDGAYYRRLDTLFEKYDALLYELVKPKDASIEDLRRAQRKSGGGGLNMIGMLQRWLKDTLELEFQLDAVDYTRDNFVHADLDIETFFALQKERGESLFTLILRSIKHDLERQARGETVAQITLFDLIRIFTSKDQARAWKLVLGRQFNEIEDALAGIEGPNGSVILSERNKVAIRVLGETIGKGKKEIGIFYGAGHMQDLEKRLLESGFEKVRQEWLVAWDMRDGATGKRPAGAGSKSRPESASPRRARF